MRSCVVAGALLSSLRLAGVEPGEVRIHSWAYSPFRVSVRSDLVEVGATVRDRRGFAVGGLQAANFEVQDRHKPQTITFFSVQKPAEPDSSRGARTIALFFDDTHAGSYDLQKAKAAAKESVETGLQPNDRVGVFAESGTPILDFTSDRAGLFEALDKVRPHPVRGPASLGVCPDFTPYAAFAVSHGSDEEIRQRLITQAIACNCQGDDEKCPKEQPATVDAQARQFWDVFRNQSSQSLGVIQVIVRRLSEAPGTRILVMLSPGFPTGELDAAKSAIIDTALRGHVVISALDAGGLRSTTRRSREVSVKFMANAAKSTGGQFVENTNDATAGLDRLTAIPAVSYMLGFSPGAPDGRFHPLRVSLRQPHDYVVEARTGYFAAQPAPAKPTVQERIDRTVASQDSLDEIPARVAVMASGGTVRVRVAVDAGKLRFVERNGRFVQQLTLVTVMEDAQGSPVMGKQSIMDLAVKPETLADFRAKGLQAETSFTLPKGTYRVREVVREAVDNRMSASRTRIEVQ
jgi:VWFA-related protein